MLKLISIYIQTKKSMQMFAAFKSSIDKAMIYKQCPTLLSSFVNALRHIDIYVDPYVSRPTETVANEASMYIYIYINGPEHVTRHAPDELRRVEHCLYTR